MKKFCLLSTLVLSVLLGNVCRAQDFSNKGKDFWVAYGYHTIMTNGGNMQEMVLYFAADQNTNVTVNIPGIGYTATYFVAANTVLTSNPIPKAGAQDARLTSESIIPEDKGIHITSDRPIVAYAHIYNQSVSGATILFPTATLGKEYYSINYTNISNSNNANCWFYVVACDPGNTTVEITPSANTLTHTAGIPFTVTLRQGQVYNMMGELTTGSSPFTGVDLTGSKIQTVNSGSGCKRIAVFSGSGRIALTCNNTAPSSDNYMVQAFPKAAWGKKYLTAPTGGGSPNNIFRICVSTPTALVTINGAPIAVPLLNNFFYEIPVTNQPMRIESNEPIIVAQYMTSQGTCGNTGPGDPEVIYLSPVEQNINKVLWNATNNFSIFEHYINVIVPSGGTALSSFRIDGVPIPPAAFINHPQAPGYSYLTQSVIGGQQHTILSDSGFNAIAYGYGSAESYGYNAGTNIKDIYQYVSIQNQYATVNFPATCKNTPFIFAMTFPYQPTRIQWIFNGLFPDVDIASPVPTSTFVVNGRTLYQYQLPSPPIYSIPTAGTYPIKVIATNPTPDGCGGEQEIDYDLQVFDPPSANFNFTTNGCVTSPVQFTDNSNTNARPVTTWHWNFGDATPNGTTQSPLHSYAAAGSYTVAHSLITDVGCLSDTIRKTVVLSDVPVAGFTAAAPQYCSGSTVTFTDNSTVTAPATITKWTWNFGEGPSVTVNTATAQTHTYANPGTYTVTLVVEAATGCRSITYRQDVVIGPAPVANFNLPGVCMPNGAAQFNDLSTIPSGTITGWNWDFGDGNTSTAQNPLHNYTGPSPFTVTLTVTSASGCSNTKTQVLNTVYAEPLPAFAFPAEVCLGSAATFTDQSTAPGSTVAQWAWDFGDGNTSTAQNPSHTYLTAGTYTVTLRVTSAVGCQTVNNTATHSVVVNPLPTASFTSSALACVNGSITLTSTSVANVGSITQYTWTINGNPTGGNNAVITFTPTTAGPYTVVLTVLTDKGCSAQTTTIVNVNPLPAANFNLPAVCMPNGAAQFNDLSTIPSGTITGWNWDFGDATTSTIQNPLHNYTGPSPFTVTLVVTSNAGCTGTKTQVLNSVYAEPLPAFAFPAEVCLGSAATFTDQSTAPGSTVAQWAWDFGDGNTSTSQNPSHTYATAGTYTVTLRVTSAVGCQTVNNTATHSVVVNPLPTASFTSSAVACQNSQVTLTSTSVANVGNITQYAWTINSTPTGGNNPVINFTPTTAGVHTVVLTVTTDKGCSAQITTAVTINPKPVANFALPNVCLPAGTANFTSTSTIASGTITGFAWDFGDGNTAVTAASVNTYTTTGPYTVSLTVTSNSGCTDIKSQSLTTIYAEPQAVFNAPAEVCLGTVTNFTDISTAPGSTVTQWAWNFGDGNTSTVKNPSHTYATAGTYTVTLSVTSAIGCQTINNTATRSVVINPLPIADFNTSLPGCVTRNITFTDASAPNAGTLVKWTWNFGDASSAVLASAAPFTHAYAATGSYNATLQVESSKGCVSTVTTKPVVINVLPKAGFVAPEACLNDVAAQFTDTSKVAPGTITAWQWNFGDANATAGNPNTSSAQNATHHYTAAGSYTATLVAISNQGCTDTTTRTFFVNGSVPVANFNILNLTALCSNRSLDLRDASSVDIGSLVKLEIYWDYTNDPTNKLVDDDPQPGENYSHTYPEFGTPASKTYTVRYIAYSGATCLSTFTRTVIILATPSLQFAPVPAVCEDAPSFQVTQAQMTNGLTGTATYTGNGISVAGLFNPATAGVGQHTITYTFLAANTCTNSISRIIEVNPKPGINAGPDKVVLEGGSVVLTPSVNAGMPVTYLWSPSTGLNNPAISNPAASPTTDMTYTVTVTSDKGCKASDDVFVKLLKKPIIPNIFSPNGDGQHDKWVVPYLESYPGCTVDIVNRYGQLVYHSVGYVQPWDGKVNGKDVPVGTYYYVIDPKNGRAPMTGYVDVIR